MEVRTNKIDYQQTLPWRPIIANHNSNYNIQNPCIMRVYGNGT